MKAALLLFVILCASVSCSVPVIRSDLLHQGIHDVPITQLTQDPEAYKGKLFILGGTIVSATMTEAGSLIELLYVPVDSNGHLKKGQPPSGMYLASYPKDLGVLDPALYAPGRMVTLAGQYAGSPPGQMGGREYSFPYFVVKQIYLWEEGESERTMPGRISIGVGGGVGGRGGFGGGGFGVGW